MTKRARGVVKGKSFLNIVFRSQLSMLVSSIVLVAILAGVTMLAYWTNASLLSAKIPNYGEWPDRMGMGIGQYYGCRQIACRANDVNCPYGAGCCMECRTHINDGTCIWNGTAHTSEKLAEDGYHEIKQMTLIRAERTGEVAYGSCVPGYCIALNHVSPQAYPFSQTDAHGWPIPDTPAPQCPNGTPKPTPKPCPSGVTTCITTDSKSKPSYKATPTPKTTVKPNQGAKPGNNGLPVVNQGRPMPIKFPVSTPRPSPFRSMFRWFYR